MSNSARDEFLIKTIGLPYHKMVSGGTGIVFETGYQPPVCSCGASFFSSFNDHLNIDFSTWKGFGVLWEWAQSATWFDLFQCSLYYHDYQQRQYTPGDEKNDNDRVMPNKYIHPNNFADAVYEFLTAKKV